MALDIVELAKSLISFRTEIPPGNEERCAKFINDFLVDLHIDDTELHLDRFEEGRANLVARLGPREPGLLLGGHLDVVPAGDESRWSHPPFDCDVAGGRLYGRGAADMKTGLAAMLKAIEKTAKASGKNLRRGISFVATAGEETGFEGLKGLIERGLVSKGSARFGVLGEPTSLRPVRAHKGGSTFRVTITGKSGHASNPRLGVNAIEECAAFIEALAAWRSKVRGRGCEPELGSTIATPTIVSGGTKSNVIPGTCELIVDARWIPRHGTAFVERGLNSIVASLRRRDRQFDARVELLYDTYALNLPSHHPAVRLAESLSGFRSEVAPYGTEAALYTHSGIPSIVLGPGDIKQAHVVDEFVELRQAKRALSIYTKMLQSVCADAR
jgi:acetylornithine deacetylase ArgE